MTTRLLVATAALLATAVGATQRGSVADVTTGCGSDDPTVTVRIIDVVPGFWWQHALYNVTDSSTTRGGRLLDHLVVPLPTPLAAGVYDVSVVTMDDHSFALIPDLDVHEQVVVSLEPPPTVGVHTSPTQDLPDYVERIESSVGSLAMDRAVDTVYVLHRSITEPDTASNRAFGHSIVPEEITFTCQPVVPPTTTSTVPPTSTTTVPPTSTTTVPPTSTTTVPPSTTTTVPPTTTTTVAPSTTVPPSLPATDGSEVEDQVLQNRRRVVGEVPSAPAAVETNLVPTYTG